MFLNAATLMVALLAAPMQQTDTTVAVAAGARLDLQTMGGSILVDTWGNDQIRVRADHGRRDEIRVNASGSVVRVSTAGRNPTSGIVDYHITVPASMDLDLGGVNVDIDVTGTAGRVEAKTVSGAVTVTNGRGVVTALSVSGDVTVAGAAATVNANSTSGSVRVSDSNGVIEARSVSGDVTLSGITSNDVDAYTLSGDVFYEGYVEPNGIYSFATHSGSIVTVVPTDLNATLTVATASGRLRSTVVSLPSIEQPRGRRRTYTAGDGSARMEFETFSGNISILGPDEASAPDDR